MHIHVESFFIPHYATSQFVCSSPTVFINLRFSKGKKCYIQNFLHFMGCQFTKQKIQTSRMHQILYGNWGNENSEDRNTCRTLGVLQGITEIPWTSHSTILACPLEPRKLLFSRGPVKIDPLNHVTVWSSNRFLADLEMYAQNIQAQLIAHCTQISRGTIVSADWNVRIYAENV